MKLKVKFSETNSQFKSKFNEKINIGSKPVNIDETLKLENNILSVNLLKDIEEESSLPVSSSVLFAQFKNILEEIEKLKNNILISSNGNKYNLLIMDDGTLYTKEVITNE